MAQAVTSRHFGICSFNLYSQQVHAQFHKVLIRCLTLRCLTSKTAAQRENAWATEMKPKIISKSKSDEEMIRSGLSWWSGGRTPHLDCWGPGCDSSSGNWDSARPHHVASTTRKCVLQNKSTQCWNVCFNIVLYDTYVDHPTTVYLLQQF